MSKFRTKRVWRGIVDWKIWIVGVAYDVDQEAWYAHVGPLGLYTWKELRYV